MSNPKTGKYADIINAARNTESGNASIPEIQQEKEPDEAVNLTIKVSKALRRHWLIEAKRADTSLTAAIVESLKARFGVPSDEGA